MSTFFKVCFYITVNEKDMKYAIEILKDHLKNERQAQKRIPQLENAIETLGLAIEKS